MIWNISYRTCKAYQRRANKPSRRLYKEICVAQDSTKSPNRKPSTSLAGIKTEAVEED